MSTIACTKDYSIVVNPGVTVDAYWSIDNPGTLTFGQFTQLDQVNSLKLTSSFFDFQGPPYVVYPSTGGLYANGLAWKTVAGPFNSGWQTTATSQLAFTGTGWSLVFWFKILFWPDFNLFAHGPTIQLNVGSSIITDSSCLIEIGFNCANDFPVGVIPVPNMVSFFINDSVGTDTIAPAAFSPPLNQWNMLHVFYISATGTFGYSLNNGANVTVNGIQCDNGPSSLFAMFQDWGGAASDTVWMMQDEYALKFTRPFTSGEVSYLFNSASGRTWPL